MASPIIRISEVLAQLAEQAKITDDANRLSKSHKIIQEKDIFSEALFSTHSDLFLPYVKEVQSKTKEFERLLLANKKALAHSRLQIIEQQISALINALNANSGLHKEAEHRIAAMKSRRLKKAAQAVMQSSHALHKKLAEHHEFERRLVEMINDRERVRSVATPAKAALLSNEILAIHQRLGRCRQAISKIEREIEMSAKR
jgi:primosomal replication protein N''